MDLKLKPHIQLKTRLLPVLVGALLIVQLIAPYDGWVILLTGLGGAWLLSYLWVHNLADKIQLRREIRFGWAQVGDRLEERFTLVNRSWLPVLWAEISDQSTMPGYQASQVRGVESQSHTRWLTQGICTRRGLFTLGPTILRTSDPFGISSLEIRDPKTMTLMVTPPIIPLPAIEVAPGGRAGEGRPRPDAPERTVSASGVREFSPGDSLRWIHWRTSARRDDLYVRLFEGTPAGDWWIILDQDQQVQAGQGGDSTEEHGVILAASLADRGLNSRRAVGLVANSQEVAWLPPREGDGQRWEILRALALVAPSQRSLGELLVRIKPTFGRNASVILITSNTGMQWIEQLLPLLWTGAVPTVLLLDPISYGGTGEVGPILDVLVSLGIKHYVIDRSVLDRPEARPGQKGRWEWRVSPTGRAIPINQPLDESWKSIS